MQEENSPEFKFDDAEPEPDELYQEEMRELRVEKLSQRITLIAILLPCLLGIILYFGYRDLAGRVTQSQDAGSVEYQKLSAEMEALSKQFNQKLIAFSTTLSTQDKDFDSTINEKLQATNKKLDENLKSISASLKSTDAAIKAISTSKADKDSLEAEIAAVNAVLLPLQKTVKNLETIGTELKAVSSDIENLKARLDKDLAEAAVNAAKSKKDLEQLQASVSAVASQKIDRDTLELELFKIKKHYQQLVSQALSTLNTRMDALQNEINNLDKAPQSSKQSMKSSTKRSTPPQSAVLTTTPTGQRASSAESESIVEQDIKE